MSNDIAPSTSNYAGPNVLKRLHIEGSRSRLHPVWRILIDSRPPVYSCGIVNRLPDFNFLGSRSTAPSWKPLPAPSSSVRDIRRRMSTFVPKPSKSPPVQSLALAIRAAATALEMTKMFLRRRFVRDVKVRATKVCYARLELKLARCVFISQR